MLIELSCPIYKNHNTNETRYIPVELSYIVLHNKQVIEVFSTRIKYELPLYEKLYWEKMFQFYVSKFPATFRTHYFYEKYELYNYNINKQYENKLKKNNIELFYKDNYGLDPIILKKTLIKKIQKYKIKVYSKNTTRIKHFLDIDETGINLHDLKDIGVAKYEDILLLNKINFIKNFYKEYKKIIKINYDIFDKESLFSDEVIKNLANSDITIYKIIVYYIKFKQLIHQ
jgi:hypothetical protein